MSKVYYIKNLTINDSENKKKGEISYASEATYIYEMNKEELKLTENDFNYLTKELYNWDDTYSIITDEKLIKILAKADYTCWRKKDNTPTIIFEIVKDVDGYFYAREIITNLLFPVCNNKNLHYRYNFNNDNKIEMLYVYDNPKFAKINYILECQKVATQNEVNEYIAKNTKKFKISKHKKLVSKYYNENVFNEEIVLKDEEALEKQDDLTKLMEEIEYILSILKQYQKDLYNDFSKKYNNMISQNNLTKPQKSDFKKLLSNIKFNLYLSENNIKDIDEYLNITTENYFNKLINKKELKEKLNINDIDNLIEMILKNKNDYSINDQRKYLTKLSLLYLLVIKDNNNLNENELNNGYFKDNIKTIIYNITILKELDIIINDFEIDELKDTSISNILNLIKKIEFNKITKEKIKLLMKE